MTAEHDEQLEQALTKLTTWHGPVPHLWRRALGAAKTKRARASARLQWLLRQPLSAGIAASIIVIALGATIAINLPHLRMKYDHSQAARRRAPAASDLRGVEAVGKRVVEGRVITRVPEIRNELESLGYVGLAECRRQRIPRIRARHDGVPIRRLGGDPTLCHRRSRPVRVGRRSG
jgi:hypothetical protein